MAPDARAPASGVIDLGAGAPPSGARVLVVEGHGAYGVDLAVGVAVPVSEAQWDELHHVPAMAADAAARLLDLPGHQPVYLRWPDRGPEWFDHGRNAWVPVDGATLQRLVANRTRLTVAKPATASGPVDPGAVPRPIDPERWPVWPVEYHERPQPNLALGLVMAAATTDPTVAERFEMRPLGSARPSTIDTAIAHPTGILLFSHYVWSTRGNLRLSAAAKDANPRLITVHGGPNAPGYEHDVARFFAEHPHVDVVVHGEGEVTLTEALRALAATGAPDREDPDRLRPLAAVPGLSVRIGDEVVRGPKRSRIADLDAVPSPYLTGIFDDLALEGTLVVVETNRGCPFGCTFCDWGSATRSRVRTFDLERVVAEIEWLAARGVDGLFVADANFGALPRDLPIAEAIADSRRRHGSPRQVVFTFAKDTAELLIPIVDLLWDVGVDVDGNLALQTVDEPTLRIVRRKNLPQPEYQRVRQQFRDRGLPLTSDIMLGLPGSTYESMRADVQFCLDHEITPRSHRTVLLPNAPMSSPTHKEQHGIVADKLQRTESGDTFTYDDVVRAANLHRLADAWDYFGIARLPLRYAARDHGLLEVDVLERIDALSRERASEYPALAWGAVGFTAWLVPPGSWEQFLTELGAWLIAECGIPDDSALRSILAAQLAVLPAPGATYPRRVELEHDVAAWMAHQHEHPGGRDQPKLATYGPAALEVSDDGRNDLVLIANHQSRAHSGRQLREIRRIYAPSWELSHALARPRMLDVEQHAFRFA